MGSAAAHSGLPGPSPASRRSPALSYLPKTQLWIPEARTWVPAARRAHQVEANDRSRGRPGFGLLMEMGTGKSRCEVDETGELYEEGEVEGWLILAPKGVYGNWPGEEIPKWMGEDTLDAIRVAVWSSNLTAAKREEINAVFEKGTGRLMILCMNIEALGASDKAFEVALSFVRRHRCKITVDESTCVKNPTAVRTKAINKLRDVAVYRRIDCGQPVPNGPMDIFSQMDWCVPGCLGRSFHAFRSRYAVLEPTYFGTKRVDLIVDYRDLEELAERLDPHTFRKRKEECLDLPPKIYMPPRSVELTDEQRRVYKGLKEECTAQLESAEYVTATMVLTQRLRLHQVACGHVVDEEGRVHLLPSNRPQAMLEDLEEAADSAIIWASYRSDIARIEEALRKAHGPDSFVSFHGGVGEADRELAKRRHNNGDVPYFVASPQVGGRGLTLLNGRHTLYYSNTDNLDHREQSEDRPHRDGQTRTCTYQDLVATESAVEMGMIQNLRTKKNLAGVVLRDGWREWVV